VYNYRQHYEGFYINTRSAGYVRRMETEKTIETFSRELEDTDCVRYLDVEGRIILRGMSQK